MSSALSNSQSRSGFSRFGRLKLSGTAIAVGSLFAAGQALADGAGNASSNIGNIQDVIVTTGTRDTQKAARESLSPIDVISAAELQKTGQTDLRDALVKLSPSITRQAVGADAANLTSALTMRGLSPN
ncbi:MAG: hypothetical protein JWQ61_2513, partial [Collimonas fungivorans]|uniref:TonB-dependent receptor plug domain-containing protein n=1 Tax=Collimonas fungivorans TaxID=158899 RepID=UPI002A39FD2B|nr:hypothetical protein [Collimonas fungivorans]